MNRAQRRLSEKHGRRSQALPWNEFEEISLSAGYMSPTLREMGQNFDRIWKNNKYIAFLLMNDRRWLGETWHRIMVRRADSEPIMSWSDMQRIKNELFGLEVEAIQFLPAQSALVDQANLYWFFIRSCDYRRFNEPST